MYRKLISLCLTFILAASATLGCAVAKPAAADTDAISDSSVIDEDGAENKLATPDKPYGGTTIRFTMQKYGDIRSDQEKILRQLSSEFFDKTGITVEWSIVDWDQALTKTTQAMTGGDAPDVADFFLMSSFAKLGGDAYGPIIVDDLVEELGVDNFYDIGASEAKIGEHWYGVPWRADTRILMYNKEHFKNAGITEPPKTWDELLDAATKLTQKDADGNITRAGMLWYVNNGRFDQTWKAVLEGAGGSVMNYDYTAPAFNSDPGRQSLKFMRDFVYEYGIMPKTITEPSFDVIGEFIAGRASMIYGATVDSKRSAQTLAPEFEGNIGGAVLPSKSGTGNSSIASSAPISILASSKNQEAAKEWVRFICAPENMLRICEAMTLLNTNRVVMEDPFYSSDEWYMAAIAQFDSSGLMNLPFPDFKQMDSWPDGPLPKLASSVMGGKGIDEALNEAQKEVEEILAAQ